MIAYPPHIFKMIRKTEHNHHIDREEIVRRKNEGGASDALKQGADDLRLYEAVDFKLRRRRLRLVGGVADAPVSSDGREKERALYTSAQPVRDSRRQKLAASVSHDLWRF